LEPVAGAKISLVVLALERLNVQFQSSLRQRIANDSGIWSSCCLGFDGTVDFTLAILALGICSCVAVFLGRQGVSGLRKRQLKSHFLFEDRQRGRNVSAVKPLEAAGVASPHLIG
jgi:hypothetical protein